ncbi:MAG: 23S rRNA (uracil(1939)-C(5))-methyltransferase RlmD [Clostridia bacterium]|nr:23S rRNA (uracil(1939)-C(5))-methyltransferase RlmD [Clostridia bacterium]
MVEKNKNYIVDIIDMTHEGAGVAKIDGFPVFIEGAILGENIEVKIVKVLKSLAYGKIEKIIKVSPDRKPPTCDVYKRCGGCNLQHMKYEMTLKFKQNVVKSNLKKFAGIDAKVNDSIGLSEPYAYRNKVQFPIGRQNNEVAVGFYANRTHEIIPVLDCSIQSRIANRIAKDVRDFIKQNNVSVYDEETCKGFLRHLMVRTAEKTNEVMIVLVTNGELFSKKELFVKYITSKYSEVKSIIQNVNTRKTNVILGEKDIVWYGQNRITDYIGDLKFNISAKSFFQVNSKQTETLYSKALEYAGLTGKETVFDLYCGVGTISLFLAQKAYKVYGVEIVEDAVADARINAKLNNISNVEFFVGKAESVVPKLYSEGVTADVVVVDPPRSGCDTILIDTVNKMKPKKIVYVSCNPATLARDIKLFDGYEVNAVQPVDMFPWTYHVETVAVMKKK